jgi:hypothetical protein
VPPPELPPTLGDVLVVPPLPPLPLPPAPPLADAFCDGLREQAPEATDNRAAKT